MVISFQYAQTEHLSAPKNRAEPARHSVMLHMRISRPKLSSRCHQSPNRPRLHHPRRFRHRIPSWHASFANGGSERIAAPVEPSRWRKGMRADYVIVGAGSAGCVLAHGLRGGARGKGILLRAGGGG